MLIEMHTDSLKPLSGATVEQRFRAALPSRQALSPLAACWRTEVGELNQLIHVWAYESQAELERVRAQAGEFPGDLGDLLEKRETRVLTPAPFSPPLTPRALGGIYEIRIYTYPRGAIPLVIENWNEVLPPRLEFSPLAAAWYAEGEHDSTWVHVWPYRDAGDRERVRAEATRAEIWPPSLVDRRLKREPRTRSLRMRNMLVVPTEFSPLR